MIDPAFSNIIGNPKFINTRIFCKAGTDFNKNGGRYTLAPRGSKDWYEFWEEEERRCKFGYKIGGVKITGRHYFYLNFTRIKKTDEKDKGKKVAYKAPNFPSFYEIDYDWFWYKEIAWHGCNKKTLDKLHLWKNPAENIDPITLKYDGTYGGGKHLGCLKTRRAGFSYKEGADGGYNYNFIPGSKSYYFAAVEQYLTVDGILNKVQDNLEFLNQNTDGFWLKNRMEKSTLMHQKASYLDKQKNVKGFLSEIIGVIINDPDKVRGKDGIKIVYEEAGSFKDLKRALAISEPSVREGTMLTGQISVFGTGGEEKGVDIDGLEEVFLDPNLFNMLAFNNDWEEGYEGTECGVFIPTYMANRSFMDLDGNIDIEKGVEFENKERAIKKTSKDPKDYELRIAENPLVPSEALLRVGNTIFPKADLLIQQNRILRSPELLGSILHGEIVNEANKGLEFRLGEGAKPVVKYPHKDRDDITGCVSMIEKPIKVSYTDKTGKKVFGTPPDVYILVVDPYYKDEPKGEKSTISLGAVYVVKQKSLYTNNITEQDVAWFVGRPGRTGDFFKIVMDLADLYTGQVQSEIGGGGQGLVDFCREKKKLDRLMFEPIYINDKEIEKISKNRSYLMDIQTDQKRLGLIYYADYLKTVVGLDENSNPILNLHYIYDLGLLEELLKFNDTGNFDRISAQIVKMFTIKEKIQENMKTRKARRNVILGQRALFQDLSSSSRELDVFSNSQKAYEHFS